MDRSFPGVAVLKDANDATAARRWSGCLLGVHSDFRWYGRPWVNRSQTIHCRGKLIFMFTSKRLTYNILYHISINSPQCVFCSWWLLKFLQSLTELCVHHIIRPDVDSERSYIQCSLVSWISSINTIPAIEKNSHLANCPRSGDLFFFRQEGSWWLRLVNLVSRGVNFGITLII